MTPEFKSNPMAINNSDDPYSIELGDRGHYRAPSLIDLDQSKVSSNSHVSSSAYGDS